MDGIVSFVFDTGADRTILMPLDARDLGVNYAALRNPNQARGIGGTVETHTEPARAFFVDDDDHILHGYEIALGICQPSQSAGQIPSLLGRDIIDRWRVTYDKSEAELAGEVISSDARWVRW